MKAMARWLVPVFMLFLATPVRADDENLVVEALNTEITAGIFQSVYVAQREQRPETVCGNPGGNPANLVDCYEFALTYVSYDSSGQQIIHLPECNVVPADDPSCGAINGCSARFDLDPLQ